MDSHQKSTRICGCLNLFFIATEPQIAHVLDGKKIEKDLSDLVTEIIHHIKTKDFIESALNRMAAAHNAPIIKNPLAHLEKIEKKPWVYTSGGTMNALVSCYYRIDDRPREIEKWVESEIELLVYLADTMKQISPALLEGYSKGRRQSLLMQSPTHAFLFQPLLAPFRETWQNEEFTYTFIRDHFVRPAEMFVERLLLNDNMLKYLIQKLAEKIPENLQYRFRSILVDIQGPLNPIFFRSHLLETLEQDPVFCRKSQHLLSNEEIDSLLYSSLPLFSTHELRERVQKILSKLKNFSEEKINQILRLMDRVPLSRGEHPILGAQQLQEICKALLCLSEMKTAAPHDDHLQISLAAQTLGFAMPTPLIFADTNWVKDMFGFVVNPGIGKLELWRLDYTGSTGYPMTSWKQWLNGSRPDLKWGIYVKPFEYGQN